MMFLCVYTTPMLQGLVNDVSLRVYTTPMLQGLVNDVSLRVHYSYVTGPGE